MNKTAKDWLNSKGLREWQTLPKSDVETFLIDYAKELTEEKDKEIGNLKAQINETCNNPDHKTINANLEGDCPRCCTCGKKVYL